LVEKGMLSIALHKLETSKSFTLDKKNFNCAPRYRSYEEKTRICRVPEGQFDFWDTHSDGCIRGELVPVVNEIRAYW
jgi:hypothetical protein